MTTRYATAKQLELIKRLSAERGVTSELGGLTIESASELIEQLFATPRTNARVQVSVGMYRTSDGTIYKVQPSRGSGRLYAKRLNASGRGFTYEQGAIYTLGQADRLTLAEAQAFGVATGFCCVCGRELTDQQSVARGIGPVCANSEWGANFA